MKKRFITGVCYVIVIAGLLVMKLLIPVTDKGLDFGAVGIDLLFWLISVIGAYEFTRALGERKKIVGENGEETYTGGISKSQKWAVIVTCALMIPAFVITKMVEISLDKSYTVEISVGASSPVGVTSLIVLLAVASVGAMVIASLAVFDYHNSDLKSTACAELCLLYCGVLASVAPNINHMAENSRPAVLLLFVLVPFVDVGAFFIGKLFGKLLPLKLAPHTSPNKTVVGAVGGVLGGVLAAVVVWLICKYAPCVNFVNDGKIPDVVVLILISIPATILAQVGDLFESAVKRNCGIKDMGNILPGHGGVLDRFDSMLLATVAIVVCFMAL